PVRPALPGAAAPAGRLRAVHAARSAGDLPEGRGADPDVGRHLPRRARAGGGRRVGGADLLVAAGRRAAGQGRVVRGARRPRRARRAQRAAVLRGAARALGPAGRRPRRARRLGPARVFRPGGPGHARSVGAPRDRREIAGSRRRAGRLRRDDHAAVAARGGPARPAVLDRAAGLGDAHAPVARRGPRRAARAPHAGPHRLPRDGPQARGGCRPPAAAAAADRLNAGRRGGDRTRTIAPRQGAVRLSGGSPVRRKVGTAHWQVPYGNGTRREDAVNHYDGPGNREPGDRGELSPAEAAAQIRFLEEEVALLRRKLTESPRHARVLEQRLAESASRLAQLSARNEKLTETLKEARSQLVALREEVDRLAQPPSGYGVFLTRYPDETV